MILLVDDTRNYNVDVIARTADAAHALLGGVGYVFKTIIIDFDLGPGDTGLDVSKWGVESETLPGHVQLVSSSPPGRKQMVDFLRDHGYTTEDNFDFHKNDDLAVRREDLS